MSNVPSILIVDSNEGFAMMLQGGLEQDGYKATVTTNGDDALQALSANKFDLAIVDLGVDDPNGPAVARSLRQQQALLRLMLIPLGDELPPELSDLDVQGILPKPFFLPDLPESINDALAKSVSAVASGSAKPTEPEPAPVPDQPLVSSTNLPDVLRERAQEITQAMEKLSREINAAVVILTSGESVIAHASRLSTEETNALAQAVAESWRTSARVAQILGEEQRRFEQSVEGSDHMFYSLTIVEDIILSAALRGRVTLGMIRHQIKSTANALKKLVSAA